MTSALFPAIADEIAACGPLTLARFMEIALHDPANGYYARHPGLAMPGAEGDFVTAPEISQMFGELIGAWAIEAWRGMGAPDRFRLVEPGPGRGTMMADLWRVARLVPDFRTAAQIRLVERSHPLRAVQAQALADAPVGWWETIDAALGPGESEPLPFILLANEFLDCLPVRQWRRLAHFQQKCSRGFVSENAQIQTNRASNPTKSGSDFVDDALARRTKLAAPSKPDAGTGQPAHQSRCR